DDSWAPGGTRRPLDPTSPYCNLVASDAQSYSLLVEDWTDFDWDLRLDLERLSDGNILLTLNYNSGSSFNHTIVDNTGNPLPGLLRCRNSLWNQGQVYSSIIQRGTEEISITPVTSSNPSLVTTAVNGNVLALDFQPNQSGSAAITVTATSNGKTTSDVFTVNVSPVDDGPVVANAIADLNATEDADNATIDLTNVFHDVDDANASITKTVISSDPSLVMTVVNGNVLTLDFQANQFGSATITVTATSNGKIVSDVFTVKISPMDEVPVAVDEWLGVPVVGNGWIDVPWL
ncbi:uncharacterized protein METZ01_LOCUS391934, partial [marine metagenome]